ncbi:MAG: DUF45 domain-containing protein [Desulforhopalus sp.]|nr:DUF45 domain-containing protein [Desulforhopalus sp.]
MQDLRYLTDYSEQITVQVRRLITEQQLGRMLLKRYPVTHEIKTDKALYNFTNEIKKQFLRKAQSLSKVVFDGKINVVHQALGVHSFVSRVQGNKLKAKNEIRIGVVFKNAPIEYLRMILVHELAHLKEKQHNKAFYSLCLHMEPAYHQLEFDLRLYLTHLELFGALY